MKLKGRIFFLVFILILVCGGCTEKPKKDSKELPQTIKETEDTPADIYEFQEEEE